MHPFLQRIYFNLSYLGKPRWDTGISPPELLHFIETHPPARALDLGCGTGINVLTLLRAGWQTTGVDFAAKAIALARKNLHQAGLSAALYHRDVIDLNDLSQPFDLILDIGCYHNLRRLDQLAYQHNLTRLLAPNGVFLLYALLREGHGGLGLNPSDISSLSETLTLVDRQDGEDKGTRASAWFTFQPKA